MKDSKDIFSFCDFDLTVWGAKFDNAKTKSDFINYYNETNFSEKELKGRSKEELIENAYQSYEGIKEGYRELIKGLS